MPRGMPGGLLLQVDKYWLLPSGTSTTATQECVVATWARWATIPLGHRANRQVHAPSNIIPLPFHYNCNNTPTIGCYAIVIRWRWLPHSCRLYEPRATSTHTFNYLENSYHLLALPLSSRLDRAVYSTVPLKINDKKILKNKRIHKRSVNYYYAKLKINEVFGKCMVRSFPHGGRQ